MQAADPTFVNCVAKDNGGSAVATITTGATSLTAGSTVYVLISRQSPCGATASVTDLAGNTYSQIGTFHSDSSNLLCTGYYISTNVIGKPSNTYTLTWSAVNSWIGLSVMQVSPAATLDTTARGDTASTAANTVLSGNWTTSQANEFEVAGMASYAYGRTWTADIGWTLDSTCTGVDHITHMQYRAGQPVHTGNTTLTISGAATYLYAGVAAFKGPVVNTGRVVHKVVSQ